MSEEDLNRSLVSPRDRFGNRVRKNLSAATMQERVVASDTRALADTYARLDESGAAQQAAAVVLGARRRFIAGEGKSAAYALLLATDLSATLSNIHLIEGRALTPIVALTDVRETDVLIVFAMRRYSAEVIRLGRLFHEAGGQLICITDSESAPLVDLANVVIIVDTGSASYADSPTPVVAVAHLLSTLISASAKGARRRLTERDRLAQELGLYEPDEEALSEN
ncbi:MurR/RpiR family transcriptional regulator [Gulosibacter sp. ACHW.36C]|uniref:SIS domain-containing protein n=1 Tax=Gulosibacter sediminis TaxID=1729695 RepID=A0ABY4MX42_9MICO|nr:SIS domain-containing protein [Gulosibacter sediminis]UQN14949.1 SIS domain-containing protein [Gulosibacter sediminis]